MNRSTRNALLTGLLALVIGIVIGNSIGGWQTPTGGPRRFPIGIPEVMGLSFVLLYLAFWGLMTVAVWRGIRWLGRDRHRRLEDLPADFDDWHRRAHAQMAREAAAQTGDPRS
jgi:TctA family transporter